MARKLSDGEKLLVAFAAAWEAEKKERYFITWGGKDSKAASDLAATGITPDEAAARWRTYFRNQKYGELCNHSFAAFAYNVNKFPPEKAKNVVQRAQSEFEIDDFGHSVRRGEVCEQCFPKCGHCGENHLATITCDEHAQNASFLGRLFGEKDKRTGIMKQIGDL